MLLPSDSYELWDVLAGETLALFCSDIGLQLSVVRGEGDQPPPTCAVSTFEIKLVWTCHLSSSKWWCLWSCLEPAGSSRSCSISGSWTMLSELSPVQWECLITRRASQQWGCRNRRGGPPGINQWWTKNELESHLTTEHVFNKFVLPPRNSPFTILNTYYIKEYKLKIDSKSFFFSL